MKQRKTKEKIDMKITLEFNKGEIAQLNAVDDDGEYLNELRKNAYGMIDQIMESNQTGAIKKIVIEES